MQQAQEPCAKEQSRNGAQQQKAQIFAVHEPAHDIEGSGDYSQNGRKHQRRSDCFCGRQSRKEHQSGRGEAASSNAREADRRGDKKSDDNLHHELVSWGPWNDVARKTENRSTR